MTPSKCKTCKWRGGRKHPGKCLVFMDFIVVGPDDLGPIPYWEVRGSSAPCGPDAKLYEKEK